MLVNMKKIAELADVNVSTVSKALNDSPDIGPKTRERILALIDKFDYHPNISARRLRKQKTSTIGICIPATESLLPSQFGYIFFEILRGIRAVLEKDYDYDLLLNTPRGRKGESNYSRLFDQQKVDGIVIVFPDITNPEIKQLSERKLAAVLINREFPGLDYVKTDNESSTFKIMEHLRGAGRENIGIICADVESNESFRERVDAYAAAQKKHGIAYKEELVIQAENYSEPAGYEAMKRLIARKPGAVYGVGDALAAGAIRAIMEAGLRIPGDIAVAGFDDNPVYSNTGPGLTTIRQPFFEMGREAIRMLINRIEDPSRRQQKKIFEGELIIRGSTVDFSGKNRDSSNGR
jgi:LacI family transcriptional regulator